MINFVQNNHTNISFKELIKNVSVNKKTADAIEARLNEKYPGDKKGRSYIERTDIYNHDICMIEQENGDIAIYTINRKATDAMKVSYLFDSAHIGTYKNPEEFNLDEFRQKYKHQEDSEKLRKRSVRDNIIVGVALILLTVLTFARLMNKKEQQIQSIKNVFQTELIGSK